MATSRITGTNEAVTEYHHDGGYDYDDLDDWELATTINCVTGTTSPVLECHKGHHDTGSAIAMAGATCNATYFRIIRPEPESMHSGIPKTDGTIVSFDPDVNSGDAWLWSDTNSSVQDICIVWNANDGGTVRCLNVNGGNNVVVGVMARCLNAGAGVGNNILTNSNSGSVFVNCLGFRSKNDNFRASQQASWYNCTSAYAGDDGFDDSDVDSTWKNCLAWGSFNNDYEDTTGRDTTCGDEDGTGDFTLSAEPFVDSTDGVDDYHLKDGDWLDTGTDVSGDAFGTDDIDFDERDGDWDVGFDEYESGVTLDQEGFRWRNDDGDETDATWIENQDVDAEVEMETNVRLRILVNATGDPDSKQFELEYKRTDDGAGEYRKVPEA